MISCELNRWQPKNHTRFKPPTEHVASEIFFIALILYGLQNEGHFCDFNGFQGISFSRNFGPIPQSPIFRRGQTPRPCLKVLWFIFCRSKVKVEGTFEKSCITRTSTRTSTVMKNCKIDTCQVFSQKEKETMDLLWTLKQQNDRVIVATTVAAIKSIMTWPSPEDQSVWK